MPVTPPISVPLAAVPQVGEGALCSRACREFRCLPSRFRRGGVPVYFGDPRSAFLFLAAPFSWGGTFALLRNACLSVFGYHISPGSTGLFLAAARRPAANSANRLFFERVGKIEKNTFFEKAFPKKLLFWESCVLITAWGRRSVRMPWRTPLCV